MSQKEWIVIADPHLGTTAGDVEAMIGLLGQLNPAREALLFLGDLFQIWAGPKKFHTQSVKQLLSALWAFKGQGGVIHLVVGNRDAFLAPHRGETAFAPLPFEVIATDFDSIHTPAGLILAHHGDLVNQEDTRYLRWRKVMGSRWFRTSFCLLPKVLAQALMFRLEGALKGSNQAFKLHFPQKQWLSFVEQISVSSSPKLLLVGHFHPTDLIETPIGDTLGLVVPGWLERRRYLKIHLDLSYEILDSLV